jgi:hypothetical protein
MLMLGQASGLADLVLGLAWRLPYETRRLLARALLPGAFERLQAARRPSTGAVYSLEAFDRYGCIFIHIPKAAGISIGTSLFGRPTGHRRLAVYQIAFSEQEFNAYFKFAFVRNPWDRLLSAYTFLRQGGLNERDRAFADRHLSAYANFDAFVRGWLSPANVVRSLHFMPQYRFLCEPGRDRPRTDFIGRFESLERDFEHVRRVLGLTAPLAHLNRTAASRPDYRAAYSPATCATVARVYRKDIQLFGYAFDDGSRAPALAARGHELVAGP